MSAAQSAPRLEVYGPIHKALRRGLCGVLVRFSSVEFNDEKQCGDLLRELRLALTLATAHLKTEDSFIHPALAERARDAVARFDQEHGGHSRASEELTQLANRLESAAAEERQALAMQLYHRYGEFVGENLVHMAAEEHVLQPLFHQHFTDHELEAILLKMRASLPQDVARISMSFMIPALNRTERAAMFGEMKAAAPPQVFNGLLQGIARPNLSPEDWQDLTHRLGLPA